MIPIKILTISFENEIMPFEIPKFRGAIIEKLSDGNVLFHNHTGDSTYRYAYPLIQYKKIGNKASIICINEGAESIHSLFKMENRIIQLGDRKVELDLQNISVNQYTVELRAQSFEYELSNWLPLNQDNFLLYSELKDLGDKIAFLKRMLIGNILSFAKGIGFRVEEEITIAIVSVSDPALKRYKDAKLMSFNIVFLCNVFLPNHIGLGKGSSHGFGTVNESKTKQL